MENNGGNAKAASNSFLKDPHPQSKVKKVIGIVSGKGGVGKSLVTGLLACIMQSNGYQTGILDADVTGPSVPKMFGISEKARGNEEGLYPVESLSGVQVMSVNLLLPNETDPVVWRGPVIANAVQQFWTEVIWKDIDFLFVDMPPGTGDVPLTVFQSLPVDGIIVVTSPQELVSMIVGKAVKMAEMMKIPVLGIVENMSYYTCPDCGKQIDIFGKSHLKEITTQYALPILGRIPLDPSIAERVDAGRIQDITENWLESAKGVLEQLI
jgi:ATPases involved in chromosome partitioning